MTTTIYITSKDGSIDCRTFEAGDLKAATDKELVRLLCDIVSGAGNFNRVTFDRTQ